MSETPDQNTLLTSQHSVFRHNIMVFFYADIEKYSKSRRGVIRCASPRRRWKGEPKLRNKIENSGENGSGKLCFRTGFGARA